MSLILFNYPALQSQCASVIFFTASSTSMFMACGDSDFRILRYILPDRDKIRSFLKIFNECKYDPLLNAFARCFCLRVGSYGKYLAAKSSGTSDSSARVVSLLAMLTFACRNITGVVSPRKVGGASAIR